MATTRTAEANAMAYFAGASLVVVPPDQMPPPTPAPEPLSMPELAAARAIAIVIGNMTITPTATSTANSTLGPTATSTPSPLGSGTVTLFGLQVPSWVVIAAVGALLLFCCMSAICACRRCCRCLFCCGFAKALRKKGNQKAKGNAKQGQTDLGKSMQAGKNATSVADVDAYLQSQARPSPLPQWGNPGNGELVPVLLRDRTGASKIGFIPQHMLARSLGHSSSTSALQGQTYNGSTTAMMAYGAGLGQSLAAGVMSLQSDKYGGGLQPSASYTPDPVAYERMLNASARARDVSLVNSFAIATPPPESQAGGGDGGCAIEEVGADEDDRYGVALGNSVTYASLLAKSLSSGMPPSSSLLMGARKSPRLARALEHSSSS